MIFFPLCVPLFLFLMIFRYFLSLSYWNHLLTCCFFFASCCLVLCAGRARDFESFLSYQLGRPSFSSFSTTTTLIVMDRPDFCFFSVFFLFPPLHHPIQHPPGWLLLLLSCWDNNVGWWWWPVRYLTSRSTPGEKRSIHIVPQCWRSTTNKKDKQKCLAVGNWPGAFAATRDVDRKSVRLFISFSR